jgi:hypothetical protein
LIGVDVGVNDGRDAGPGVAGNIVLATCLGVASESVDGVARGVELETPNDGMAEGRRELTGEACESNLLEAKKFGTAAAGFSGSTVFSVSATGRCSEGRAGDGFG